MHGTDSTAPVCVVGVTANRMVSDDVHRDVLRRNYVEALASCAGVDVAILPTTGQSSWIGSSLLCRLDGLVLTGDESNLDPSMLTGNDGGEGADYIPGLRDRYRDRLSATAIRFAVAADMPILAICRGMQELNVYFGGTLEEDLRNRDGGFDHREDLSLPREQQYVPVHDVELRDSGVLGRLTQQTRIRVNSLHGQGIDQLGNGLVVEGRAEDGLIEAISIAASRTFQLGVQWHPEWEASGDPQGREILRAFGAACQSYRERRG